MLKDFVWPHLAGKDLFFMQDGAPVQIVRDFLDKKFPNRLIGRLGPIERPARSPSLTPADYFLWGYLKEKVYGRKRKALE